MVTFSGLAGIIALALFPRIKMFDFELIISILTVTSRVYLFFVVLTLQTRTWLV